MNTKTIGMVMMIIGLLMTVYTGFNYVTQEKIIDLGSVEVTAPIEHNANWSPFIGIGVTVIGGVVFLAGKKK